MPCNAGHLISSHAGFRLISHIHIAHLIGQIFSIFLYLVAHIDGVRHRHFWRCPATGHFPHTAWCINHVIPALLHITFVRVHPPARTTSAPEFVIAPSIVAITVVTRHTKRRGAIFRSPRHATRVWTLRWWWVSLVCRWCRWRLICCPVC